MNDMKKIKTISALLLLALTLVSCGQEEGKRGKGNAEIIFAQENHDYGEITFKGDGNCEFAFRNTGKTPLLLTHVKSTCGCTVPEWPSEPIKEGEQGVIKVSYDTQRVGTFMKSIYVYSNASNGVQKLYIRGTVKPHNEETEN